MLQIQGKYEVAEVMNHQALDERGDAMGKEHPEKLGSVNNLATVLRNRAKYEEAEKIIRRAGGVGECTGNGAPVNYALVD